jgi:hypothetical protein
MYGVCFAAPCSLVCLLSVVVVGLLALHPPDYALQRCLCCSNERRFGVAYVDACARADTYGASKRGRVEHQKLVLQVQYGIPGSTSYLLTKGEAPMLVEVIASGKAQVGESPAVPTAVPSSTSDDDSADDEAKV